MAGITLLSAGPSDPFPGGRPGREKGEVVSREDVETATEGILRKAREGFYGGNPPVSTVELEARVMALEEKMRSLGILMEQVADLLRAVERGQGP